MDEFFSPNNQYKVSISSNEIRMSHWIDQPYLIRVGDNETLFKLDYLWSASNVNWSGDSIVTMYLRQYPGLLSFDLTLDVASNQGQVKGESGSFSGTLAAVGTWLNSLESPAQPVSQPISLHRRIAAWFSGDDTKK